jgi:UDP-3-O-[3-hydroxymyristoyl] N-acetylglucosamine deacetylase
LFFGKFHTIDLFIEAAILKVMTKAGNYQTTLKFPILLSGIGVHSGKAATVLIEPAPAYHGVIFERTDVKPRLELTGHFFHVTNTQMATTLGSGRSRISTVEHLLSGLKMMGVDNAIVKVNGPEIPVLDGSAFEYCEAIERAGIEVLEEEREWIKILKTVEVPLSGGKIARVSPSETFQIHCDISWDHPRIGHQKFVYQEGITPWREVALARTFGFLKDVEALRKMGLALGGSLDNAVVLDPKDILNPEGLRYQDEFVRHKVLDAIGDLSLCGYHIKGNFEFVKAGHDVHVRLLHEIFRDEEHFLIISKRKTYETSRISLEKKTAVLVS